MCVSLFALSTLFLATSLPQEGINLSSDTAGSGRCCNWSDPLSILATVLLMESVSVTTVMARGRGQLPWERCLRFPHLWTGTHMRDSYLKTDAATRPSPAIDPTPFVERLKFRYLVCLAKFGCPEHVPPVGSRLLFQVWAI